MRLLHQIRRTYIAPLIVLICMLVFLMAKGVESAYTIYLVEAEMTSPAPGQTEMILKGGNLLRVNSFYVGGERVEDCTVERVRYDTCRVVFTPDVFSEGNTWYEIRVGYHKWGVIDLLSSPIWVEWTGS